MAVDRTRVDNRVREGRKDAALLQRILHHLSFHLSGAQLGITVTSVVVGFIAEPTVARLLEGAIGPGLAIALALLLVTVVSMVLGELIPKNLAIARADRVAAALARPMFAYGTVFGPLIRALNAAANGAVRRFGIEPKEELTAVRSLEELALLINSSGEKGTLDADRFRLLTRTLRFNEKIAAEALVPRLGVASVGPDDLIPDLVAKSVATGFSRFPMCREQGGDLDDLVGVVHVKDVYRVPPEDRATTSVAAVVVEPFVVPETIPLARLLVEMRTGNHHLAVVVDEYGGTAGIITLEDVLEEIVGEIDDEYDRASSPLPEVPPSGTSELPGTMHPDEVSDATGFEVPDGAYETLAGFVLDRLGRIPEPGDRFAHHGWWVEAATMDRRRVATVRLTAPTVAGHDGGADDGRRDPGRSRGRAR